MPSFAETVHWTAKIKWVNAQEDDAVWVGLDNPINPNPATSPWKCSSDIVWLGTKDKAAPKSMTSVALTLYSTFKTVRIGVRGTGSNCEAMYLSARE